MKEGFPIKVLYVHDVTLGKEKKNVTAGYSPIKKISGSVHKREKLRSYPPYLENTH